MEEEVRYHMLRPAEIVARRKACPVAYIPIGTIEWHGHHNPTGADSLQAEGFAIMCARQSGGLAFPPLYYGENRVSALVESDSPDAALIANEMELPPENFSAEAMPFTSVEQSTYYQFLLQHILAEVENLGFKVGVLVAGHYPLIDCAEAACLHHNKRRFFLKGKYLNRARMLAWTFMDALLVEDKYATPGDHGGAWETSHLMHLHPQTVDLSKLPPKGEKVIGVGGRNPPQDSSAEFGREIMQASTEVILKEVQDRLKYPDDYARHGRSLELGLWKKRERKP